MRPMRTRWKALPPSRIVRSGDRAACGPLSCAAATSCAACVPRTETAAVYVVSWLQSEQAVLSLLECGVDQYMAFPLSLQRLREQGVQRFEPAFMTETLFMIYPRRPP